MCEHQDGKWRERERERRAQTSRSRGRPALVQHLAHERQRHGRDEGRSKDTCEDSCRTVGETHRGSVGPVGDGCEVLVRHEVVQPAAFASR